MPVLPPPSAHTPPSLPQTLRSGRLPPGAAGQQSAHDCSGHRRRESSAATPRRTIRSSRSLGVPPPLAQGAQRTSRKTCTPTIARLSARTINEAPCHSTGTRSTARRIIASADSPTSTDCAPAPPANGQHRIRTPAAPATKRGTLTSMIRCVAAYDDIEGSGHASLTRHIITAPCTRGNANWTSAAGFQSASAKAPTAAAHTGHFSLPRTKDRPIVPIALSVKGKPAAGSSAQEPRNTIRKAHP